MKKMYSKGYVTLAIGSHYRHLANNLAYTYRLNGDDGLPLCLAVDSSEGVDSGLFDKIVYIDQSKELIKPGLHKFLMNKYSPFEETIYIDADMFFIKPITFLWKEFEGMNFSFIGSNSTSQEWVKKFYNFEKAQKKYGITSAPTFNGGFFYFKSNQISNKIFDDCFNLIDDYDYLEMPRWRGPISDEGLFSLAMAIQGEKSLELRPIPVPVIKKAVHLKLDVLKGKCNLYRNGVYHEPCLLHFLSHYTRQFIYKREANKLKMHKSKKSGWSIKLYEYVVNTYYILYSFLYNITFLKFKRIPDFLPVNDPAVYFPKAVERNINKILTKLGFNRD